MSKNKGWREESLWLSANENVLNCINLMGIKILENNNLKLDSNGEKRQSEPLLEAVGKQNEKMFVDNRKKDNGRVIGVIVIV